MKPLQLKTTKAKIEKQKVIQDWLEGLRPNTVRNYLNTMAIMTILTGKTPTELLNIAWQEQEERVPPWQQQIETWYTQLKEYDIQCGNSKNTAEMRKTGLSAFFHFYKIQTPRTYLRRGDDTLKVKNEREGLTKQDLRDLINGAKTFKLKALILSQATSGLALVDVLKLNINQFYDGLIELDDKREICRIYQKRTKTSRNSKEHYTFINFEAVEFIKKHLQLERIDPEGPLFSAMRKGNKRYTEDGYSNAMNRLNKKLGWANEKNEFAKATTHMFRKFFETSLTNSGMISEHVTHMMGWKMQGMRDKYYLAHPEELEKSYIKHLDYLTLENVETVTIDSPDVREIKENQKRELEERDKKIAAMEKDLKKVMKMARKYMKAEKEKR